MNNAAQPKGRWRRALRYARPQRRTILAIVGLTLVVAAINAIEPLIIKFIFDGISGEAGLRALAWGLIALAAAAVLRESMSGIGNWLTWRMRIRLQHALLGATVAKLHSVPLRLQRSEGVGAVMTRLDRSIKGFTDAISLILFNVLPSVIFLAIAVVIMLRLDWRLACIVLAFAPMPALLAMRAAPEQRRRERALLDQWAQIYSRFNEVLSGIMVVRSFAMERMEKSRFLRDVAAANRIVVRGVATDTGYGAASNFTVATARLLVIGVGGYLAIRGQITIGTVIAFLGYVGGLFGPVQGLSNVYSSLSRATVSLEEIFSILDVQEHLGDAPDAVELTDVKGDVAFEHVSFRYDQEGRPLIDDLTLRAEAGETVALVGPSGSGKTTLMALLMRFYDPHAGRVTIDGRDLRQIKQGSLRRKIGVVLQDPLLFNDTVRANIAYGRPEASMEEIEKAARAARAHDFISRLPEGYDAMAGERGSRLSVGERQRVTIARAILKEPAILILDEATSALDPESEEAVQAALETMMRGRTTFIIAHRLATVINADFIAVLKQGRIAEYGRHEDLVAKGGYYASLVRSQSRGLIQNDAPPNK